MQQCYSRGRREQKIFSQRLQFAKQPNPKWQHEPACPPLFKCSGSTFSRSYKCDSSEMVAAVPSLPICAMSFSANYYDDQQSGNTGFLTPRHNCHLGQEVASSRQSQWHQPCPSQQGVNLFLSHILIVGEWGVVCLCLCGWFDSLPFFWSHSQVSTLLFKQGRQFSLLGYIDSS